MRQYGDFQTPHALAADVCVVLGRRGINPTAVLEPTCGRGAFVIAAAESFPDARTLLGVELNPEYVSAANQALAARDKSAVRIELGNFFVVDWDKILDRDSGPWLILGNPPWVTNAELGSLKSTNLPSKSNFKGHRGLDAITGKANFDISEWMILEQIAWLRRRSGWIAMLVKTSVARKVLRQAWKRADPVGRAAIFKIDAMHHFGAAVDACLFVLPVNLMDRSQDCDVFGSLDAAVPDSTIGLHDNLLVSDVAGYERLRHLIAPNDAYVWRSGVKHDCSRVMELSIGDQGHLVNGEGEEVRIEDDYVFPMLKSSDVANGRLRSDRFMIVPQRAIGSDTAKIKILAPKTWEYLINHAKPLDERGSVIYKGKPRFSIFGVGKYTFAPWKVAVSGFYKEVRFLRVGPQSGRPVIFDDTIYFLPCQSEEEADFLLSLVRSAPFRALTDAMIFRDEKRPVTAEFLKRISLDRVANELKLGHQYERFAHLERRDQLAFKYTTEKGGTSRRMSHV